MENASPKPRRSNKWEPPTVTVFKRAVASSLPGTEIVYWRGELGRARLHGEQRKHGPTDRDLRIAIPADKLARAALTAWRRGFVELVQRRLGVNNFEYIAIKRRSMVPPIMRDRRARLRLDLPSDHRAPSIYEDEQPLHPEGGMRYSYDTDSDESTIEGSFQAFEESAFRS